MYPIKNNNSTLFITINACMDQVYFIDQDKSIAKKHLVYTSGEVISDYINIAFILLIFIGCIADLTVIQPIANHQFFLWKSIAGIIVVSFLLVNTILMNALVSVRSKNLTLSYDNIDATIFEYYPLANRQNKQLHIIRYYTANPSFFKCRRVVTLIVYQKKAYINITTFGRSMSPFHGLINYFISKRIAKDLTSQCNFA